MIYLEHLTAIIGSDQKIAAVVCFLLMLALALVRRPY